MTVKSTTHFRFIYFLLLILFSILHYYCYTTLYIVIFSLFGQVEQEIDTSECLVTLASDLHTLPTSSIMQTEQVSTAPDTKMEEMEQPSESVTVHEDQSFEEQPDAVSEAPDGGPSEMAQVAPMSRFMQESSQNASADVVVIVSSDEEEEDERPEPMQVLWLLISAI